MLLLKTYNHATKVSAQYQVHYTVIKNNKTKDLENAHATILLDRKSPT